MKTSELIGPALDWAVATAEGGTGLWNDTIATWWIKIDGKDRALSKGWAQSFNPSTNWSQGGPIIERERIDLRAKINAGSDYDEWMATVGFGAAMRQRYGPTPLTAAMRCLVTWKLGAEIEIPEELLS